MPATTAISEKWFAPKPKSFTLTAQYYKECIEQAATFNTRVAIERRSRLPFLDSQTGVAQTPCSLYMPYRYRSKATNPTQLYIYPAKRWRKRKRAFEIPEPAQNKANDLETGDADMHQINTVENPAALSDLSILKEGDDTSGKGWYDEMDILDEPPDAGEIDERNSDSSDYEEAYLKKRKKKKAPPKKKSGRGRKSTRNTKVVEEEVEEKDKPYACDMCGARYKTRPGLTYHITHTHNAAEDDDDVLGGASATPTKTPANPANNELPNVPAFPRQGRGHKRRTMDEASNGRSSPRVSAAANSNPSTPPSGDKSGSVNNYCDFCLGDETENKKTGTKEELVSCADCGRSGHPSCLQFTPNMIISVKKYPWQCIECKSCGLCGTSDNDDQLLFCDDCDRGYHMYCLNPPLSEPPEGNWSCHLCIQEFYGGKKPPGML